MRRPGFLSLPCHPDLVAPALGDSSVGSGGPRPEGKKEACLSTHPAAGSSGGGGGGVHPELDRMGEKLGVEQRLEHQPTEMLLERKPHSHPPCTTTSPRRPDQPPTPHLQEEEAPKLSLNGTEALPPWKRMEVGEEVGKGLEKLNAGQPDFAKGWLRDPHRWPSRPTDRDS